MFLRPHSAAIVLFCGCRLLPVAGVTYPTMQGLATMVQGSQWEMSYATTVYTTVLDPANPFASAMPIPADTTATIGAWMEQVAMQGWLLWPPS